MIKPTSEQSCNTHACVITRCDENDSYINHRSTGETADSVGCCSTTTFIWNNYVIGYNSDGFRNCRYGCNGSIRKNGYLYTCGDIFFKSGDHWSCHIKRCIIQTPI